MTVIKPSMSMRRVVRRRLPSAPVAEARRRKRAGARHAHRGAHGEKRRDGDENAFVFFRVRVRRDEDDDEDTRRCDEGQSMFSGATRWTRHKTNSSRER